MNHQDPASEPNNPADAIGPLSDSGRAAVLTRSRGMLLGAAVGDALGWAQEQNNNIVGGQASRTLSPRAEFRAWSRYNGGQYARYIDPVEAGAYSDDAQLTLCVARAVLHGESWHHVLTTVELPTFLMYSRGAGRAVLAASRAWSQGAPPWLLDPSKQRKDSRRSYFNAGANGAAMRIAPHVVATVDRAPSELFARVVADGVTTHGHPRALVGATVHAAALRALLRQSGTLDYGELLAMILGNRDWADPSSLDAAGPSWIESYRDVTGRDPQDDWQVTAKETDRLLSVAYEALTLGALAPENQTLEAMGCFDPKRNGAGTISAVAAAFLASRAASQPQAGLLASAFLERADTDTLASMAATLLGALHGHQWLQPLSDQVQDAKYLVATADALTELGTTSQQPMLTVPPGPVHARDLDKLRTSLTALADEMVERNAKTERPSTVMIPFVDGRDMMLNGPELLETKTKSLVRRWHVSFSDGQSAVVDITTKSHFSPSRSESPEPVPADRPAQAPATAGSGSVDLVVLGASNIERSARFYQDVLGISLKRIGESVVALSPTVQIWGARRGAPFDDYPVMVTVTVSDLKGSVARAEAAGAEVLFADLASGEARIRDPDGHVIRLFERKIQPSP